MKKLLLLFFGIILAFTACESSDKSILEVDDKGEVELSISSTSDYTTIAADGKSAAVAFRSVGGDSEITVNTDQRTWQVTSSTQDWLTVTNTVTGVVLSAHKNSVQQALTATVTITVGSGEQAVKATIEVSQKGMSGESLEVDKEQIKLTAGGEYPQVVTFITERDDWDFKVRSQWLLVERGEDNTLVFTADPNPNASARSVDVDVTLITSGVTESLVISVTQEAKSDLTLSRDYLSYETAGGAAQTVTITTNQDDFELVFPADQWFTATKTGGNDISITVNAHSEEANRVGKLGIQVGKLDNITTKYITLAQVGGDLSLMVFEVTTPGDMYYVTLPLATAADGNALDCVVDWGDGVVESITVAKPTHRYASQGVYYPSIKGSVSKLETKSIIAAELARITKVTRWGKTGLTTMQEALKGCVGITSIPGDTGHAFDNVKSFANAFDECNVLKAIPSDIFVNGGNVETFSNVFRKCISVVAIPANLFANCPEVTNFGGAFLYMYTLESIPAGLFDNNPKATSFNMTFQGSTGSGSKLTSIPTGLFDKSPDVVSFNHTFYGTGITSIPAGLFDKNLKVTSFSNTFMSCHKLLSIPTGMFAKNQAVTTFREVFNDCIALTDIPTNLFNAPTLTGSSNAFFRIFSGCAALTTIPSDLLNNLPKLQFASEVFNLCTSLAAIPANLFEYNVDLKNISTIFGGCKTLTSIPATLFDYSLKMEDATKAFQDCTSLASIPEELFGKSPLLSNVSYLFKGCSALTSIPEKLLSKNLNVGNISYIFQRCTGLTALPTELFDSNKKISNMASAFEGCTNITGESPFGMYEGVTKVHYYQRASSTNGYNKPLTTTACFKGVTQLSDYSSIPTTWR